MVYTEFNTLITRDLTLRDIRRTDLMNLFEVMSDPEVTRYMLMSPHTSLEDTRRSIERSIKSYSEGRYYRWGITLRDSDILIGNIQLLAFDEKSNCCSFAYMLGKKYWGKGYGSQAITAVIKYAFEEMHVDYIHADHFRENIASGEAMKKSGMFPIETQINKYEKNGVHYDAVQYIISKDKYYCTGNYNTVMISG